MADTDPILKAAARERLYGGGPGGMGLIQFLGTTSEADPLRPDLEHERDLAEKALAGDLTSAQEDDLRGALESVGYDLGA